MEDMLLAVPFHGVDSMHEGQCVPACFKMCLDFLMEDGRIKSKKRISLSSIDRVVGYRSPRYVSKVSQIAHGMPYSEYGVEYSPSSKPMKALESYLWKRGYFMKYYHYGSLTQLQRMICENRLPVIAIISLGDWKPVLESTDDSKNLVIEGNVHDLRHAIIINGFAQQDGNYLISLLNPDSRTGEPVMPTAGQFMGRWGKSGGYGWFVCPRSESHMIRDTTQQGLEVHIE